VQVLEVGTWTWNWMEPPLGQLSFFLLTLQLVRAHMGNLGVKPYTAHVLVCPRPPMIVMEQCVLYVTCAR
jgi:hypothetical protein